jgi:hypothetical protein
LNKTCGFDFDEKYLEAVDARARMEMGALSGGGGGRNGSAGGNTRLPFNRLALEAS